MNTKQKTLHAETAQLAESLACTAEAAYLQKIHRVLAQKQKQDVVTIASLNFVLLMYQQIKNVEELHQSKFLDTTKKCPLPETDLNDSAG
jgi:hypothetical protein